MTGALNFLRKDELVRSGGIMLAGAMAFNLFSYFYHFSVGRMLGPVEYGVVSAVLSLTFILGVPTSAVSTVVTKFTSQFKSQGDDDKVRKLFRSTLRKVFLLSLPFVALIVLLSSYISSFLNLSSPTPILILAAIVLVTALSPVTGGVLSGLQRFPFIAGLQSLQGFLKFSLGVSFVYLGFGANGALAALFFAGAVSFLLSFRSLLPLFDGPTKSVDSSQIYSYSRPVILTTLASALLYNMDIVLVKHYFPPVVAGYYAAASLFAKMIYFAAGPILQVMFPKVSDLHSRGSDSAHLMRKALLLVLLIGASGTVFYWLFSPLMIALLFGPSFAPAASILFLFAVAMSLFSVAQVFITYHLSTNNFRFLPALVLASLLEILLIVRYHSTLSEVVGSLALVFALLALFMAALSLNTKKSTIYHP